MRLSRQEKLGQRCEILAEIIHRLKELYEDLLVTQTQKDLLETLIGAAIWYLPECNGLYTGKISSAALRTHKQTGKYTGLTKEHCYPRKRAGKYFLSVDELTGKDVLVLYQKKFGRYNYVTKEENRKLVKHQRQNLSTRKCYAMVGIELLRDPRFSITPSPKRKKRINAQTH
jgi:hypothetical protein